MPENHQIAAEEISAVKQPSTRWSFAERCESVISSLLVAGSPEPFAFSELVLTSRAKEQRRC